ncbi:MAG: polysaccharide biosynthesis tyrosine autokinase, partial [Lachnospiraceae bacterium]|nr:polysaccharide biosynthesis tyrosine autokinase [Lachnospiraceae bacterium]
MEQRKASGKKTTDEYGSDPSVYTGERAEAGHHGGETPGTEWGQVSDYETVHKGRAAKQVDPIDLVEIFYLMWGNMWKILICLILGGVIAFSYTWFLMTPQFQATAKIYIVSSSSSSVINLTDLQLGTQLTADYEELILNHELLQDVIDELSLDMTYTELAEMVTLTNPDDTRILRITVTSPDPAQAQDIANELSEQAIIYLPRIMSSAEPNIAEKAVLPTSPSSPSLTRNTLMGALLGAFACIGVILMLYLMDDTIKSPDDLEKYFGVQPLSTVVECHLEGEKKKKKKQVKVPGTVAQNETARRTQQAEEGSWTDLGYRSLRIAKFPALPFDVMESLNQLRVSLNFCGSGIKNIMITSSIPNEGKSFIAIHLWKAMAESGQKTLLIDADLRNSEMRSAYGIISEEKIRGIVHYLAGKIPLEDAIYQTNVKNGYMIPLDSAVVNPIILLENDRFARMIEECSKEFDYILVDTPPIGSMADALNIATHCDGTVMVVRGGETPRKLVRNSVQLLRRTGTPLLGLVLNRAEINNKASSYYYRRYYRYGGYYYKNGYGHYCYGATGKKTQSKNKKVKK